LVERQESVMDNTLNLYNFQADLIGTFRVQPITITQHFASYPFVPPTTISGMLESLRKSLQYTLTKSTYLWMNKKGENQIVKPTQLELEGVYTHFGIFGKNFNIRKSTRRIMRIGEKKEEMTFGVLPFEGYVGDNITFYVISEKPCKFLEDIRGAMLFVCDNCLIYINDISRTICKIEQGEYLPLTPVPIEHVEQRLKSGQSAVSAKIYMVPLKYLIDGDVLIGVERKLFVQLEEGLAEGRYIKVNGKGLPIWW